MSIQYRLLGKLSFLMLFALMISAQFCRGQEVFQGLYTPNEIKKHKVSAMTINYFVSPSDQDSTRLQTNEPDIKERFRYDSLGRADWYEATDHNVMRLGTPGPHQISFFEYSEIGNTYHRHDSTVFGNTGVWNYTFNSKQDPLSVDRHVNDNEFLSFKRDYVYDLQGRMEKERSIRYRSNEGKADECYWKFYVHDNYSFSATSLSPAEFKNCSCNLEYLDDKGRTVREVSYDSLGNIAFSTVISYDRTGKPIKLVNLGADSKTVQRLAEIVYERDGIVKIVLNGPGTSEDRKMAQLGIKAREFVISNWPRFRLLQQIDFIHAEKIYARYEFDYVLTK